MIEIITELLHKPSNPKVEDIITIPAVNLATEGFAKKIAPHVEERTCPHHPEVTSVLKLIADKRDTIKVDKSGFCCQEFADAIQVNITK